MSAVRKSVVPNCHAYLCSDSRVASLAAPAARARSDTAHAGAFEVAPHSAANTRAMSWMGVLATHALMRESAAPACVVNHPPPLTPYRAILRSVLARIASAQPRTALIGAPMSARKVRPRAGSAPWLGRPTTAGSSVRRSTW